MRRLMSRAALVVGLVALPGAALAQGAPRHEFGVDVGLGLQSPSGGTTQFVLATPVDVRVGFVSASPLSWEGRLTLMYASKGFGNSAAYTLAPDIQALYKLGAGKGPHGLLGSYLTAGAGLNFEDAPNGVGGTNSSVVLGINGGIGDRLAWGPDAFRIEGFVGYNFRNTTIGVPGTLLVGARVGVSFWR